MQIRLRIRIHGLSLKINQKIQIDQSKSKSIKIDQNELSSATQLLCLSSATDASMAALLRKCYADIRNASVSQNESSFPKKYFHFIFLAVLRAQTAQ